MLLVHPETHFSVVNKEVDITFLSKKNIKTKIEFVQWFI